MSLALKVCCNERIWAALQRVPISTLLVALGRQISTNEQFWQGCPAVQRAFRAPRRAGAMLRSATPSSHGVPGELNFQSAARRAIEDGAARDDLTEHLLKAKSLSAKLHQVAVGRLPFSAFDFDRKGIRAELNLIGASRKSEPSALQPQTAHSPQIVPHRLARQIGTLTQKPSFGGQAIFPLRLLKMNESPLPRTKGQMLQPAEWQGVVGLRRKHGLPDRSSRSRRNPLLYGNALRTIAG